MWKWRLDKVTCAAVFSSFWVVITDVSIYWVFHPLLIYLYMCHTHAHTHTHTHAHTHAHTHTHTHTHRDLRRNRISFVENETFARSNLFSLQLLWVKVIVVYWLYSVIYWSLTSFAEVTILTDTDTEGLLTLLWRFTDLTMRVYWPYYEGLLTLPGEFTDPTLRVYWPYY